MGQRHRKDPESHDRTPAFDPTQTKLVSSISTPTHHHKTR